MPATPDGRRVVGGSVFAKAMAVSNDSKRIFGVLWNSTWLRGTVLEVLRPELESPANAAMGKKRSVIDSAISLEILDWVPPSAPPPSKSAKMFILEDDNAVIAMIRKGRSNLMRHVGRVHEHGLRHRDWQP